MNIAVADPGFPVGGHGHPMWVLFGKMCVKTKEFGPIGGVCTRHAPLDPPMHCIMIFMHYRLIFG